MGGRWRSPVSSTQPASFIRSRRPRRLECWTSWPMAHSKAFSASATVKRGASRNSGQGAVHRLARQALAGLLYQLGVVERQGRSARCEPRERHEVEVVVLHPRPGRPAPGRHAQRPARVAYRVADRGHPLDVGRLQPRLCRAGRAPPRRRGCDGAAAADQRRARPTGRRKAPGRGVDQQQLQSVPGSRRNATISTLAITSAELIITLSSDRLAFAAIVVQFVLHFRQAPGPVSPVLRAGAGGSSSCAAAAARHQPAGSASTPGGAFEAR